MTFSLLTHTLAQRFRGGLGGRRAARQAAARVQRDEGRRAAADGHGGREEGRHGRESV